MIFFKKSLLLVFIIGLLGATAYAQDSSVLCAERNNAETLCPAEVVSSPKFSATNREYPVNNSVNPCFDFYQYACSGVIANFKLPEDQSSYNFSFDGAITYLRPIDYLRSIVVKPPTTPVEEEIHNYYFACMDEKSRVKEELVYIAATKERLKKIATKEEFMEMVAENITSSSQTSFVEFTAIPNLDRPEYNDIVLVTSLCNLPDKSYYKNEELLLDLQDLITELFTAIGEESPQQKAWLVINFEKELAESYPTMAEIMDSNNSRTEISRESLIKDYPNLKLGKFLSGIPEKVIIRAGIGNGFIRFLNEKLNTASLEELKPIFLFHQLSSVLKEAYPALSNKKFEFAKKYFGGPEEKLDREYCCLNEVVNKFEKEIDAIILPKLFPDFPKNRVIELIEKVRLSFLEQLKNNTWLSASARAEAIRKIEQLKLALVSPNNDEEWYFNPLGIYVSDTPLANEHQYEQLLNDRTLKEFHGPINKDRWIDGPLKPYPTATKNYNKISLPIGILQYPFYDPQELDEVNLGAIGAIIGHEFGHLLDNQGNRFDADGVFKFWMSEEDKAIFAKKSQQLVTQFDKIGHNGKLTLEENSADLLGITTAYQAAFPVGKETSSELKRKFFLQFARLWCEVAREGSIDMRLKTNTHSIGAARVNEQMKHQPGFKEAYSCKPDDPMVIPEGEIVKIW